VRYKEEKRSSGYGGRYGGTEAAVARHDKCIGGPQFQLERRFITIDILLNVDRPELSPR
jgi:hypothetical protein